VWEERSSFLKRRKRGCGGGVGKEIMDNKGEIPSLKHFREDLEEGSV